MLAATVPGRARWWFRPSRGPHTQGGTARGDTMIKRIAWTVGVILLAACGIPQPVAHAHSRRRLEGACRTRLHRPACGQRQARRSDADPARRRSGTRARRARARRQALCRDGQRQRRAHESRRLGAGGVRQHRRPRAGLRLRCRRPADRRRRGEGPARDRPRPQGDAAHRQGGRRSDPVCRCGGGRQDAARSISAMRRRALVRHCGAARSRPRCSTSSSRRPPAASSSTTPRPRRPASS